MEWYEKVIVRLKKQDVEYVCDLHKIYEGMYDIHHLGSMQYICSIFYVYICFHIHVTYIHIFTYACVYTCMYMYSFGKYIIK
jgi:hypothetical protein